MVLVQHDGASEHHAPDGSLRSLRADPLGTGSGSAHVATDGGTRPATR